MNLQSNDFVRVSSKFNLLVIPIVAVFFLVAATTLSTFAQTSAGQISGTVTDATGATVPGATVNITDEATQLSRNTTTNGEGFYLVTNLAVGNYMIAVTKSGFGRVVQKNTHLVADGRLTADFSLSAGDVSATVEIVAGAETVNTTSGEVARVIDTSQLQNMALNGRNYLQLLSIIPGTALLNDDQLNLASSVTTQGQAINGNRGNQNNLTVDGGFNLAAGSNGSQINNVGVDFIQEVKVQTSNFSAEYGRNSGAAINVVTRSGGNKYHGGVLEYFRNDKLDARDFFSPVKGKLRFNNFGWNFNGPIIKKKLFIFAGQEYKYIRRDSDPARRSLPTRLERIGDFSFKLRGADGIVGTADDGFIRDPLLTGTCSATVRTACFGGNDLALRNKIPANRITAQGAAIMNIYSAMERLAVSYSDAPTTNNAVFQQPNPFNWREDIVRIDYKINEKHSVYGRYLFDDYNLIDPYGTFIDSALPTIPTNRLRPGTGIQLNHLWLINATNINEFKFNLTKGNQQINPYGDVWKKSTYNYPNIELYPGARFPDGIPNVGITNLSSFRGPSRTQMSPAKNYAVSDNFTSIHGNHTLKFGALITRNIGQQNGQADDNGLIDFSTSGNTRTTGNAVADALLGNFRTYTEAQFDPVGKFRFSQYEFYVSDNWRVSKRLSLEIGVRSYYIQPTYTAGNNVASFDPAQYNPAQAVTMNQNGTINTALGGNKLNGLVRGGNSGSTDPIINSVPVIPERGIYKPSNHFAPRFSFAYAPFADSKTAIRGGFGMFWDKIDGNIIFPLINTPPFLNTAQYENGNLTNISGGTPPAAAPFGIINTISRDLVPPYTMNFSLGVQRELFWGMFLDATYVGNLGRHLVRRPDLNLPSFAVLSANAALPTAQQFALNSLRPYKGYSEIRYRVSDTNSNYNSMQLYLTKRKGDANFSVSYTWSKVLTDSSSNTEASEEPFSRSFNYGPATFDRRHIFVTSYSYSIPFHKAQKDLTGKFLGGWELSGIVRAQTGAYLTPTGLTAIGTRRADYIGGPLLLTNPGPDGYFNPAAFAAAPATRRGNAGVGILQGPGRQTWDLSVRKIVTFSERYKLRLQADFFNIFNKTNFGDPATVVTNTSFGTNADASRARNIQFGAKFNF